MKEKLLSTAAHHLAARIFARARAPVYEKCVPADAARQAIDDAVAFEKAWELARLDLDGLPIDDPEQQAIAEGYCDERR